MKKIVRRRTLPASKLQLHLARASVNGDKHANSADRLALELRAADVLGGDANSGGHLVFCAAFLRAQSSALAAEGRDAQHGARPTGSSGDEGGRAGTVSSLWFEVRAYRYVSAASSSAAMPAPTLLAGLAFAFFVPGFPRPNPFNVLSNARRTS